MYNMGIFDRIGKGEGSEEFNNVFDSIKKRLEKLFVEGYIKGKNECTLNAYNDGYKISQLLYDLHSIDIELISTKKTEVLGELLGLLYRALDNDSTAIMLADESFTYNVFEAIKFLLNIPGFSADSIKKRIKRINRHTSNMSVNAINNYEKIIRLVDSSISKKNFNTKI